MSSTIIPKSDADYSRRLLSDPPTKNPEGVESTISGLSLQDHIEGGFFAETDRDKLLVPNPFLGLPYLTNATSKDTSETRNASTTIFYLVGPTSPVGYFHRNRGRTVHTLHKGRGRYVLLHVDQRDDQGKIPVETFVVGHDLERGEKLQWIVEGGKFKASFLLPDSDETEHGDGGDQSRQGLLISETVVPGFEYSDHDFLTAQGMVEYLDRDQITELKWLLKRDEQDKLEELLKGKRHERGHEV